MDNYYNFINECRLKKYDECDITHEHHIIPRHMGGDNSKDNLILLSIEDHYTAHLLLADSFPVGNILKRKNLASANLIARGLHNEERIMEYRESLKGTGNPNYGNKWTHEQKKLLSNKIIKVWSDPKNLEKIMKPKADSTKMGRHDKNGNKNPFYGKTHSNETLKILSEKRKGVKPSNIKKVYIHGEVYEGLNRASEVTGIKVTTIWHRIHSDNKKYENYKYIN